MKKTDSSLIIVIIAFLFVSAFAYFVTTQFIDRNLNDYTTKQLTNKKKNIGSKDIVLVVVDDKSLAEIRWPWPRTAYSDVFDFLQKESKAIVFDAVITSPDSYNPKADEEFYKKLPKLNKLIAGFTLLSTNNTGGEALPSSYDKIFEEKIKVKINDKRIAKLQSEYYGIIKFPKNYIETIPSLGSVMIPLDRDGIIRKYMPVVEYNNKLYPSLALSAYAKKTGINEYDLFDGFLCSTDNCKSLRIPISQHISKHNNKVKTTGIFSGYNWYTPTNEYYTHKVYSAIDIINSYKAIQNGKKPLINPEEFKDKIVLIGGNANSQSLEDRNTTPILVKHSGLDIQATAINNMLDNKFSIERNPFLTVLLTIVFATLIFHIVTRFSITRSIVYSLILMCFHLLLYNVLLEHNIEISILTPIVIGLIVITFTYTYKFIVEGQNKEKIKNIMGKYISKDIMQNVIENIDHVKVGGIKSEVTILFADIRGFTSIAETLSAEELTGILNEYFSTIEPIIRKYDGVLNKFMGDAVMAIFGEPIKNKQHAINAVKCANEILRKVKVLQTKLLDEGKPKIAIGVGINTGEVFVGNIGSEERLEYTVIGDTVNLASRIEAHNKIYKTQFLISENTYNHINNIADVIKISNVSIRGKARKIDIYEVLRIIE